MFKVKKTELSNEISKNLKNKNNWKEVEPELKHQLKKIMLEKEQNYFCPYCETKITEDKSEIEHIRPKDRFHEYETDYNNMLTCCKTVGRCGSSKGNKWEEAFIVPTVDDPEEYLTYDLKSGRIIPKHQKLHEMKNKAKITIELLNLNDKKLCDMRKVFIIECRKSPDYIDYYEEFPTLKKFIKNL